jgi:hypothetical protein
LDKNGPTVKVRSLPPCPRFARFSISAFQLFALPFPFCLVHFPTVLRPPPSDFSFQRFRISAFQYGPTLAFPLFPFQRTIARLFAMGGTIAQLAFRLLADVR